MVVNTKEQSVDDDGEHDQVLKGLRLYNSEALQSEAIDWFDRNNFWVGMHQKSLNFDPFLLLIAEVIRALSFLDLLIELVNDNGDEQIHDEERRYENVDNVQ